MRRNELQGLLATVGLALAVPSLMAGLGSRLWRTPNLDPEETLEPFRVQLGGLRRTIDDIQLHVSRQAEAADWTRWVTSPDNAGAAEEDEPVALASSTPLFDLVLRGTGWIDETRPYANVNNRILTLGDVIDGFHVTEIRQNRVSFIGPDGQVISSDIDDRLRERYREIPIP